MQMDKIIIKWDNENASLNDLGIKALRNINITYRYCFNELQAYVYGDWHTVAYSKLYGNTYQVCFQ